MKVLIVVCLLAVTANGQYDPNAVPGRNGIVHLFEWKFSDIANECETFLAPRGYAGVQVSPVNEYAVIPNRPWWERYQPVSYNIISRSGDESEFLDMTTRCNAVGVRIYVDVVFNHMTAQDTGVGTGGSTYDGITLDYPGVPYTSTNFHRPPCPIIDYNNALQVRICELYGLRDLSQGSEFVRGKIVDFLNKLVELGAAGFRVDAASYMMPADLEVIYSRVTDLNTAFGFAEGSRAFIYQEVNDIGGPVISPDDYTYLGRVTDYQYGYQIAPVFRSNIPLNWLEEWGTRWGLLISERGLVFIENQDNQRGHDITGGDWNEILTYKDGKQYKNAVIFMLSWPHGYPRLMSSYAFTDDDQGPPADANGNILGPDIQPDGSCGNGWVCEHRWREFSNMIEFSNVVEGTVWNNWWDNGLDQIAYCRGNLGFIAFNGEPFDLDEPLQTCLPAGTYCDVISGSLVDGSCTGKSVTVDADGIGQIIIGMSEDNGALAIHAGAMARDQSAPGGN